MSTKKMDPTTAKKKDANKASTEDDGKEPPPQSSTVPPPRHVGQQGVNGQPVSSQPVIATESHQDGDGQPLSSVQTVPTARVNSTVSIPSEKDTTGQSGSSASVAADVDGETATHNPGQSDDEDIKPSPKQQPTLPPVFGDVTKIGVNLSLAEHKLYTLTSLLETRFSRDMRQFKRELVRRFEAPPATSAREFKKRLNDLNVDMVNVKDTLSKLQNEQASQTGIANPETATLLNQFTELQVVIEAIKVQAEKADNQLSDIDYGLNAIHHRVETLETGDQMHDRAFNYLLNQVQTICQHIGLPAPTGNSPPPSIGERHPSADGSKTSYTPPQQDNPVTHNEDTAPPTNVNIPQKIVIIDSTGLIEEIPSDIPPTTQDDVVTEAHARFQHNMTVSPRGVLMFDTKQGPPKVSEQPTEQAQLILPLASSRLGQPRQGHCHTQAGKLRASGPPELCGAISTGIWNDTFEGKASEDIHMFFKSFETYCIVHNVTPDMKAHQLWLRLRGYPQQLVGDIDNSDTNAYSRIHERLITTFGGADQTQAAKSAIEDLQYGDSTSYTDFVGRLMIQLKKAYPKDADITREARAYDLIMTKLPYKMKLEMIRCKAATLADLNKEAPAIEVLVREKSKHNPLKQKTSAVNATYLPQEQTNVGLVGAEYTAPNAPRPSDRDRVTPPRYKQGRQRGQNRPSPQQNDTQDYNLPRRQSFGPRSSPWQEYRTPNASRSNDNPGVTCGYCGLQGHPMVKCRKFARFQQTGTDERNFPQRTQSFQGQRPNRPPPICFNCGQSGHISRACFQPRQNDTSQLNQQFSQMRIKQPPRQQPQAPNRATAITDHEYKSDSYHPMTVPQIIYVQPPVMQTQLQATQPADPTIKQAPTTENSTNAIATASDTKTPAKSDEKLPTQYTAADFKNLKEQVKLLSSKLYQKIDQEDPSPDITATLTRHEKADLPEYVPVDYRLAIIPVTVQGYGCTALFDSGSSITLAPIALAGILDIPLEESDRSIKSVTGHTAPISKKGRVSLTLAGHTRNVEIFFTENHLGTHNPYDIIIGVDVMTLFPRVIIDAPQRQLTVGDKTVSWKTKGELLREERKVFVVSELTIPANTQTVIEALIDKSKGEVTATVTIEKSGSHPVNVISSLTEVKDYKCKVALANHSSIPVTLRPYTVIGTAANTIGEEDNLANVPDITAEVAMNYHKSLKPDPSYVIDYSRCQCSDQQKTQLRQLLTKHDTAFSKNGYDLGMAKVNPMEVRTTTEEPFRPTIYSTDRSLRDKVREDLEKMKDMGCIQESNTPWLSPLVMVKKKNGELRPCIDLRKLNNITIPDYYPLPKVTDAIDRVAGSHWLTGLDLNKGFWQLPLSEDASWKCGIISEHKVYQCLTMPFGLRNAPSAFTRAMDTILGPLRDKCVVYIDDVIIMTKSDSFECHLADIEDVLKRLLLFDMKINPKKCDFARREITFLGHCISADGIKPDERNLVKIQELPTPKSQTDVRHVLGVFSFFRRLIPSFAHIATPLTSLCGKGTKFHWDEDCQKSFDTLKEMLSAPPVIHFPYDDRDYHIFIDASQKAIGIALTQAKKGDDKNPVYHPISYYSRALSKAEQKRPAVQLELMAIIYGLRVSSYYTYGQITYVHTDHKPLIHLLTKRSTHPNLARWLIELQQYDNVHIRHIKGTQNTLADALSRIEFLSDGRTEEELEDAIEGPFGLDSTPEQANALWSLRSDKSAVQLQLEDTTLANAIRAIQDKTDPASIKDAELRWYVDKCEVDDDGTLFLKPRTEGDIRRLIVPSSLRQEVFRHFHSSLIGGGHPNSQKTQEKMQNYHWRGMPKDIADWHKRCLQCQIRAPKRHKIPLVMTRLTKPFQKMGLDICGPLHLTTNGNLHYLLAIDWFTKYIVTIPIPDTKSQTVVRALWEHVILKFGTPQEIVTDNAKTFTSNLFTEFMTSLEIRKEFSTPHHSDGNSITERPFRTFHDMIAKFRAQQGPKGETMDWDILLPIATFAYNVSRHKTTGETPFMLMHGRDPMFPTDLLLNVNNSPKEPLSLKQFRAELVKTIEALHVRAAETLNASAIKTKDQADKICKDSGLSEGELVLYRDYSLRVGISSKYKNPWGDTYRIRSIDGQHCWIVPLKHPNNEPKRVHLNQVKRFYTESEQTVERTSSDPPQTTSPPARPAQNWRARKDQRKKDYEHYMANKSTPTHVEAKRRGEGTKYNLRQLDNAKAMVNASPQ